MKFFLCMLQQYTISKENLEKKKKSVKLQQWFRTLFNDNSRYYTVCATAVLTLSWINSKYLLKDMPLIFWYFGPLSSNRRTRKKKILTHLSVWVAVQSVQTIILWWAQLAVFFTVSRVYKWVLTGFIDTLRLQ